MQSAPAATITSPAASRVWDEEADDDEDDVDEDELDEVDDHGQVLHTRTSVHSIHMHTHTHTTTTIATITSRCR